MGRLTSRIIPGDWNSVAHAIATLDAKLNTDATPTFAGLVLSGLTASRLAATNSSSVLVSSDLYSWVTETNNRVLIADGGDGTITFSTPQEIHTGATPTFAGLTLSSIANEVTDVDKFLVDSSGIIKYRTGAELLSDIGGSGGGHLHDGDMLQHDAVNSDGGAFSFTTTGLVTFNQSIASANYTAANLLTACATNAGALDFSATSKTLTIEDDATVSQDYSADAIPVFAGLTPNADDTNDLGLVEESAPEFSLEIEQALYDGTNSLQSYQKHGFTFTPTSDFVLAKIEFYLSRNEGGTGNITLEVTETTAGLPSGSVLGTVTIDGSSITDSGIEWVAFELVVPFLLTQNIMYAAYLVPTTDNIYVLRVQSSGNPYDGGTRILWTGAWSKQDSQDGTFRIYSEMAIVYTYTRWQNLYLSGILHDGTVSLSVADAKAAYDFTTALNAATDGQLMIGDTGNNPVLATLTGTADQITVTGGAGSITLSTPQDIHTGASPTFADLTLTGKLDAGSQASPIDVTNTRQYGFELHYSGNNYSVTGIRSRAQLVTTDTTATAIGGFFQAANNDDINAGVLMGFMAEAIGKSTVNAATVTTMRGGLIGTEWGALDTVTNLKTLHLRGHSRNAAGAGSFGTGYALYIENEAVGGNGQAYDAGIYFKGTNLSAGNKAFTYGIDFSGATFGTADIKLTASPTITWASGDLIFDGNIESLDITNDLTVDTDTLVVDATLHTVNIGGTFLPVAIPLAGVKLLVTTSVNSQMGIELRNTLDSFSADSRIAVSDTTGHYMSFSMPSVSNGQSAIFGLARKTTDFLFNFAGTARDLAIGTANAKDFILGTNNAERMRIDSSGNIGINEAAPETLLEMTSTVPYLTLHNSTEENSDGGRESRINFKGEQDGTEETTLARIEVSHDGSADDEKGKFVISVNDGNDGNTPTLVITVNSAGRLGIGTGSPNAPLEVKGLLPGDIGGNPSGLLHVTAGDDSQFANSVITGHNSYGGNTQLWYLGSTSYQNNNIAFINRQNASVAFWTNDTERFKIDAAGITHIGDGTNETQISATGVLSLNGLAGLQLPHMMQSDSTTQSVVNTSAAQIITFNTDVHHFGITRTSSSRFTILKEASYLMTISALCDTTIANKDIEVWMRVNGNDVANSNTIVHLGTTAETTLAVTYIYHFDVGDYFEFWMTGENTGCRLLATAAGTNPTRPACPSIIMTCNYTGVD